MPKSVRDTKNPIGRKFLAVMDAHDPPLEIPDVAAAFGVKVPSVYDWINHGRVAKTRYAQLVTWSGRSLDWWFDIPPPPSKHTVQEPKSSYGAGLSTAQLDVLNAFGALPPERRKIVRDELMAEAALYISAVREFQRREGVKSTVSVERAAQVLPVRPDGEQPETVPGPLAPDPDE